MDSLQASATWIQDAPSAKPTRDRPRGHERCVPKEAAARDARCGWREVAQAARQRAARSVPSAAELGGAVERVAERGASEELSALRRMIATEVRARLRRVCGDVHGRRAVRAAASFSGDHWDLMQRRRLRQFRGLNFRRDQRLLRRRVCVPARLLQRLAALRAEFHRARAAEFSRALRKTMGLLRRKPARCLRQAKQYLISSKLPLLSFSIPRDGIAARQWCTNGRLRRCVALSLRPRQVPRRPWRRGCADKVRKASRERPCCFSLCGCGPGSVASQPWRSIVAAPQSIGQWRSLLEGLRRGLLMASLVA
jgi:hypothetical protein